MELGIPVIVTNGVLKGRTGTYIGVMLDKAGTRHIVQFEEDGDKFDLDFDINHIQPYF